jgi:hypothetical protein
MEVTHGNGAGPRKYNLNKIYQKKNKLKHSYEQKDF